MAKDKTRITPETEGTIQAFVDTIDTNRDGHLSESEQLEYARQQILQGLESEPPAFGWQGVLPMQVQAYVTSVGAFALTAEISADPVNPDHYQSTAQNITREYLDSVARKGR